MSCPSERLSQIGGRAVSVGLRLEVGGQTLFTGEAWGQEGNTDHSAPAWYLDVSPTVLAASLESVLAAT